MDQGAIESAVERYRLTLPRSALSGEGGDLVGSQAGSSLELHDFREYQPGDDPRQVDWNAVARTGRLYMRVRREEVSPRVEVLVDASCSMAVSAQKRERTRELASLFLRLARSQGLTVGCWWLGSEPRECEAIPAELDGRAPLGIALERVRLRRCGVRLLVSDLLSDGPTRAWISRLSQGAALLGLVQVLDAQDVSPEPGGLMRLVDSESGEALDMRLDPGAVGRYLERFSAHQRALTIEARRAGARLCQMAADGPLDLQLREKLVPAGLLAPRARAGQRPLRR